MGIQNQDGSLFFATGIDNTGLMAGGAQAMGILKKLGRQVTGLDIFAGLGVSMGIAAGKVVSASRDMAREFEMAMKEVETISDATQANFSGISDAIIKMSTEGPDGAKELAKAYYQVVSAGYDGADGLELLDKASRAAVAGLTDVKVSADALTTVMNAWGYSAKDAEHITDIFFQTVKRGKTTFGEMATSISQVAPLAAALGISFDEVSAAIATLTKQGTTTSMAITQIRQAMIALNDNLGDGWGETMTFQEALQKLRDMSGGSNQKLKEMVGRIEGVNAILATTGDKAKMAAEDLRAMGDVAGATTKAFNYMAEADVNMWKRIGNKYIALGLRMGSSIVKGIQNAGVPDLLESLADIALSKADELTGQAADIERTRVELENLVFSLNKSNLKEDERKRILERIKEISPDIAEGIKKEGDNYVVSTEALVAFNNQKLNEIVLAKELQRVQAFNAIADAKQREADEKRVQVQRSFVNAYMQLGKVSEDDANVMKALLDGSIELGTSLEEVSKRFGESTATFLNQAGLQISTTQKDFLNFQLKAINQLLQRNGLSLEAVGIGEDELKVIKAVNVLLTEQGRAQKYAKDIMERRAELAKILGISLDELQKKAPPENGGGGGAEKETIRTYKAIEDEIKAVQTKMETASKAEYEILNIRLQLLKNEKKAWDDLADAIEKTSQKMTPIAPGAVRMTTTEDIRTYFNQQRLDIMQSRNKLLGQTGDDSERQRIMAEFDRALDAIDREEQMATKLNNSTLKTFGLEVDKINSHVRDLINNLGKLGNSKEGAQKLADGFFKAAGAASELSRFAGTFNSELADGINNLAELSQGIGNVLMGYSSGDPFQIVAGLAQVGTVIGEALQTASQFEQVMTKINSVIELQNYNLQHQADIINAMVGTEKISGTIQLLSDVTDSMHEIQDQITKGFTVVGDRKASTWLGRLFGQKDTDTMKWFGGDIEELRKFYELMIKNQGEGYDFHGKDQEIKKILDQYDELMAKQKELVDQIEEPLTGTTWQALADDVAQMFESMNNSSQDFADSLETNIRKALINAFKIQFLEAQFKALNQQFALDIADGISAEDIAKYSKEFNNIIANAQQGWEAFVQIAAQAGIDLTKGMADSANTLTGQVQQSITEDTGTELVGLWNRTSLDIRAQLEVMRIHSTYFEQIAIYTGATSNNTAALAEILEIMRALNVTVTNRRDNGY